MRRSGLTTTQWILVAAALAALLWYAGSGRLASPRAAVDWSACEPSYPTLCLPRGGPDLDCADVKARRFPVRGADPFTLDADGDGVGCE